MRDEPAEYESQLSRARVSRGRSRRRTSNRRDRDDNGGWEDAPGVCACMRAQCEAVGDGEWIAGQRRGVSCGVGMGGVSEETVEWSLDAAFCRCLGCRNPSH
ncbi:hypothetical protein BM1_06008 [Bipolaris maydis]|nr:hypothetical protein BM1_06008 [Bipolaris maydis]